jgi:hypothetical protein
MNAGRRQLLAGGFYGAAALLSVGLLVVTTSGAVRLYLFLHSSVAPREQDLRSGYFPANTERGDLAYAEIGTVVVADPFPEWLRGLAPLLLAAAARWFDANRGRGWLARGACVLVLLFYLGELALVVLLLRYPWT